MDALQAWVMQIILFLLLAFVLDMLLPDSAMRKYVKLTLGLMLLLIFLKPVFVLFDVNTADKIEAALASFSLATSTESIENSIESKKSEIEAVQQAYIQEQMAVQLMEQANPQLEKTFQVKITDITVELKEGEISEATDSLEHITVTVAEEEENTAGVEEVDEIIIDSSEPHTVQDSDNEEAQLAAYLRKLWEVDEAEVEVFREGGKA